MSKADSNADANRGDKGPVKRCWVEIFGLLHDTLNSTKRCSLQNQKVDLDFQGTLIVSP
jgi:hypothetical protein